MSVVWRALRYGEVMTTVGRWSVGSAPNQCPRAVDCLSPNGESGTSTSRQELWISRARAVLAALRARLPADSPCRTTNSVLGQPENGSFRSGKHKEVGPNTLY